MFDFIRGELVRKSPDEVVIEAGSIGWTCEITLNTYEDLPREGTVQLFTHLHITENSHGMYGFADPRERDLFVMLSSASGIGPKKAINLLSQATPGQILQALQDENTALLEQAKGIGPKTARRLIVELQDKAGEMGEDLSSTGPVGDGKEEPERELVQEAVQALEKLGYSASKSRSAVKTVSREHPDIDDSGELVKRALKEAM